MSSTGNRSIVTLLPVLLLTALLVANAFGAMKTIPQRSDIEDQYTWKVEDIYPSDQAWEQEFTALEENYERLRSYEGRLGESPATLLECLKLRDSLELIADNLYVYAYLKLDQDNRLSTYQEMGDRISGLWSRVSEAMSYIRPELLALGNDRLLSSMNSTPELDLYRFYLEDLMRQKEHILSEKEESILALAGPVASAPGKIFNMINDADISYGSIIDENGDEIELTKERYYKILESKDRRVRREANEAYNRAYMNYLNSLAATLSGSVKKDYFYMQARGYETCLDMALDDDNIPPSVFHNLIDAVNDNLEPLHKWTAMRKKMLGYDTLHTYDLSVPLLTETRLEYPYDKAQKMILEGLTPIGETYVTDLEQAFHSRWIDVYETEGKGSGAYQWGTYSSHPYLLMNYNGTLDAVFTLAHELGHAMHSFYTNRREPYVYSNHSLFVAEVSSTCNEAVLMKHLLETTTDKEEKMALLNHYIKQIVGTFYTQVMFSEFELAIHETIEQGGALSADNMRQMYREIYQKYWGPELVIDSINDLGCMRIGHFYRQYYVYQYATCYAAAQMMSQKVLEDPAYLDTYMQFLSTGSSKYPVEILQDAGVDMTSPEPIQRTIRLFAELVDEVEKLLAEG